MSEVPTTNGTPATEDFDLRAARSALFSSSTTARIAQLRLIDEKLSQNGKEPYSPLGQLLNEGPQR
jgi:hypothetical protein